MKTEIQLRTNIHQSSNSNQTNTVSTDFELRGLCNCNLNELAVLDRCLMIKDISKRKFGKDITLRSPAFKGGMQQDGMSRLTLQEHCVQPNELTERDYLPLSATK